MKKIFTLVLMFVVGGAGGIFIDRYALPQLAQTGLGNRFSFLRRLSERTTIINKTEVVKIEETEAIPDLAERVKDAVVPVEYFTKTQLKTPSALLAKLSAKVQQPSVTSVKTLATGLALTNDGYILMHTGTATIATDTIALVDGSNRLRLEFVSSDTSTGFILLYSPQKRYTVLPFEDNEPRLGYRLFTLSAQQFGEDTAPAFGASLLSTIRPGFLGLTQNMEQEAIVVNFEGHVVGMNLVGEDCAGGAKIIRAAELRKIADALLAKKAN